MKVCLNGNLILRPYTKTRELRQTEVATGFVATANKMGVECLELLLDSWINLSDNHYRVLEKGSKIYFKEEVLHTQNWPKQVYESQEFPEGFVIGNIRDVLFIEEKE